MRRRIVIAFIHLVLLNMVWAQTDVTPTPQPVESIFYYDTCSPPCWLGLIPGKSTPADVERVFRLHPDIVGPGSIRIGPRRLPIGYDVDPDTGYMISGVYSFATEGIEFVTPDIMESRVEIRSGVVDLMVIYPYEYTILLSDVLQKIDNPDIIRLYTIAKETTVLFIYSELHAHVYFNLAADTCRTSTLLDTMHVYDMLYYAPAAAVRLRNDSQYKVPQVTLTGYFLRVERDVPSDVWQSWLNGEVDISCEEAWEQLPQPEVTPAPEVTVEPAATQQP